MPSTQIALPRQHSPAAETPAVPVAIEKSEVGVQLLYELIAGQPFFKEFNPQQLRLLTDSALEMRFEVGELLFQEGKSANRFYLILEGAVVLESELPEHDVIPIQTLGPGDDLGWSWLFAPYILQANARATKATRTIFFYGPRLREQCEQDHDLGYHLMRRIAEVLIQRLEATQQRLMESIRTGRLSSLPLAAAASSPTVSGANLTHHA